jgi:hypothetical protein
MKWLLLVSAVALAGQVAARAGAGPERADLSGGVVTLPSAEGRPEPVPGVVFQLPGPPAPIAVVPTPAPTPAPAKVAEAALPPVPPPSDDAPPVLRRAPRLYPAGFESDSSLFCQAMIGVWTPADASALLGEATHQRLALGQDQSESGLIFAFADPTGRYQELELDFSNETGVLRGVFAYPWKMTWEECRGLWGANVMARKANQGRTFYSYLNRRLDVLVDPTGKVISLGLY